MDNGGFEVEETPNGVDIMDSVEGDDECVGEGSVRCIRRERNVILDREVCW